MVSQIHVHTIICSKKALKKPHVHGVFFFEVLVSGEQVNLFVNPSSTVKLIKKCTFIARSMFMITWYRHDMWFQVFSNGR